MQTLIHAGYFFTGNYLAANEKSRQRIDGEKLRLKPLKKPIQFFVFLTRSQDSGCIATGLGSDSVIRMVKCVTQTVCAACNLKTPRITPLLLPVATSEVPL
ncbi:hypothetical protein [Izhakiella australiensis]|uniref:hypothetical protein n=1 Tax=Izhakiella australiensis TaxID=1926881 RepID=UPI001115787E|nr:hypothetical protein [Izhakiella australiensis]